MVEIDLCVCISPCVLWLRLSISGHVSKHRIHRRKSQQGTMTGVFYLWRSIGNVLGASLTLVSYENSLSSMLWNYMFKTKRDDEYHFTKKQYYSLINDSSYLRGPNFPTDIFVRILDVYKRHS